MCFPFFPFSFFPYYTAAVLPTAKMLLLPFLCRHMARGIAIFRATCKTARRATFAAYLLAKKALPDIIYLE
jgi:hypothetical protein